MPPVVQFLLHREREVQPPVLRAVAAKDMFRGSGANPAAAVQGLSAGGAEDVEHSLMALAGPASIENTEIQLPKGDRPLVLRGAAEKGKFRAAVHHRLV